jgi:hypothetical protein
VLVGHRRLAGDRRLSPALRLTFLSTLAWICAAMLRRVGLPPGTTPRARGVMKPLAHILAFRIYGLG